MSDMYRTRYGLLRKEYFILMFSILALLLCCRENSTRWGGKIRASDGIIVVENPSVPIQRNTILNLKDELTIGREDAGESYLFSDISGLDVDNEGRIYIINRPDANIRVFDANGLFLKSIGRKGQGPGEMQMPIYLQVVADREIFVVDYAARRVLFFRLDGVFIKQQPVLQSILPIRRDSKGNIIGREVLAPPPLGGSILRAYDADLRPVFEIAKEEQGKRGVFDIGKPACYCVVRPDDSIVWGDSNEYVLHFLGSDGRQTRRVTKPYEPVPIPVEYRNGMRDRYADPLRAGMKIEFRSHFPAFGGIFADDAGRIFVKTYELVGGMRDVFYYDVFDPGGRFFAKLPINLTLDQYSVWKNGKLYTHEIDPGGFPIIKRFQVDWDNKISPK